MTKGDKCKLLTIKLFTGYLPPSTIEMYPSPRLSSFQSCSGVTGSKPCCHDRFCTVRPWYNAHYDQERRPDKPSEQMRRILMSMESSQLKGNKKNPLDILARLFPKQSVRTLKRTLELCQGDPVFAIERILDRYPSEMDIDDVPMTPNEQRQERRLFGMDDDMKNHERRIHGASDDHLSKLAMAYDIPLSLSKGHRDESAWDQKPVHPHPSNVHSSELRENGDRSEF